MLDAARTALARRPWSAVRMVDVAAAAGVSRQTLYNEFGGKDGLARALVRSEADGYLAGVERALAGAGDPVRRLTAVAEWTASAAHGNAVVRAMLTGCWDERLPVPRPSAAAPFGAGPARRGALPSPADLLTTVRDRAVAALSDPQGRDGPGRADAPGGRDAPGGADVPCAPGVSRTPAAPEPPEPSSPPDSPTPPGSRTPPDSPTPPGSPAPSAPRAPADGAELADVCELVFRLALSCVAAPPEEAGVTALVSGVLRRHPL
ncbi:TetR/AcrR family transcriptional regulator [Streptomyces sp. SAT1]|uniref:TetR/AcrR family transcriptional regulator n=1 Tax=Streptomyces sp. SAT1 TaxID=1849967 RepID=UPI003FCCDDB2